MEKKVNIDGKAYVDLSDEEIKQLPKETRIYILDDNIKAIPPQDCEHSFVVEGGIKYCTKCIYWEFTTDPPTECLYKKTYVKGAVVANGTDADCDRYAGAVVASGTDADCDRYAVQVQNGEGYYDDQGCYRSFHLDDWD